MKKMKNKENEKKILYKQYQQQNENDEEPEEQDIEEDNLEAKEKKKNLIVYGMMGILGLFIIFLLTGSIYKKENTRVIYRDAEASNRVIKTSVGEISDVGASEQNMEEYTGSNRADVNDIQDIDGNMPHIKDLYDSAVENGFMGTREEFYELLNNWNYSEEELERNVEKLQEIISQVEDIAGGEDGKDGANGEDGENGRDGKDGRDGRDGKDGQSGKDGANGKDGESGKDAYEIAVDAGFNGTRSEWLQSIKGEDGAFSGYKITSDNNNVFLYKETD